ncbi:MAG: hypothetical protein KI791_03610 [Cyclobacteriaceae bacterium]|nr:hypothetical protein [Cyclobacteriaceae bacterium SS2]
MDNKFIELISEEIRETRNLTLAVEKETAELRKIADAAQRKADAAWELVIMTREEIKQPFWRRLLS